MAIQSSSSQEPFCAVLHFNCTCPLFCVVIKVSNISLGNKQNVLRSTTAYTEFKELDMKDVMGRQGYACHEQEFNTQLSLF